MVKQLKILVLVFIASLFIGTTFVKSSYAVTAGQVNIYDMVESEWDYCANFKDSTGTGFRFEDERYSLDEQIEVKVNATDNEAIEFTVTVGTETVEYYTSGLSFIGIYLLLSLPYLWVQGLENHIETDAYLGLDFQKIFYIEPVIASEFFELLTDDLYIASEYSDDDSWTHNHVAGVFDTDSNIAEFTWYFDTRYKVGTDKTDLSGQYRLDIDYDQTTGLLHRYRIAMDYSGVYEYDDVELKAIQEIELHDDNQNGLPGFSWLITLPAFATLGLLSIIVRKKKR